MKRLHPQRRPQVNTSTLPTVVKVSDIIEETEKTPVIEVSGLIEETDSAAEGEDNIVLDNDVSFSESEDEPQNKDLRKHLNKVLPELTALNAKDLAAEIARGGNITIPEKQMEENILHNIKAIRRQNEINEANLKNNSQRSIKDRTRDSHRRTSQDNKSKTIKEEIESNIRRRAGEKINKAYGRHRDQDYTPTRKSVMSRLGKKKNTDSRDQGHIPDRKPISSRLGKKNTTYSKEHIIQHERNSKDTRIQDIREEEYEDVDEISETESEDMHSRRSPPRGDQ